FTGRLTGKFNLAGSLDSFAPEDLIVSGQANLNTDIGKISARDIEFARGQYRAKVGVNNIDVRQLSPQVPQSFPGKLTGTFNIAGSTKSTEDLTVSGNAAINAAGGKILASDILVFNGRYQAKVATNNLLVRQLSPRVPQSFPGRLTGKFNVAGSINSFEDVDLSGNAAINTGSGKITASNILVNNGKYRADVGVNRLRLRELVPQIPEVLAGGLTGRFNIAGSVNSFENVNLSGNAAINAAGGKITASNIKVNNGRYQAILNAAGVNLNKLNQRLKGKFASNLQVAGNLNNPSLADIRANGKVQFSQGIPGFEKPIDAVIAWTGN
ncbi:MAG: hypothetical protein AAFX46_21475, partial [Cyanobacteria bacterium J06636_27]